jgi:hypothetical protein
VLEAKNGNAMESGDILTPNQLAARLQVGVNWVYEKCRNRGKHNGEPLPVLRCGRYLRFYWPEVCVWLRGRKERQAMTSFCTRHATGIRRIATFRVSASEAD